MEKRIVGKLNSLMEFETIYKDEFSEVNVIIIFIKFLEHYSREKREFKETVRLRTLN